MKNQSNLSRLMQYAGRHKYLTYSSWILSALSAFLALAPFIYIWLIIREVLGGGFRHIVRYGRSAVFFAVLSVLVYIAGLMCSHMSAFRVAANIRIALMSHIVSLPVGEVEKIGSGKLRKIVTDSSAATENYLAHRLPDKAGAVATPIGLLVMLAIFDWRLGLLSLIPVILGFFIMAKMTGSEMEKKMNEYQNALADMSNEAVEYVRGIPVVKTFGQTVFSFKRFKGSIDKYEKWAVEYTKSMRIPMMLYTAAVNSVFAFLIAGGIILSRNGVTSKLLLNLLFYVIITPVISTTLTKLMFMSEDSMIVADAIARIDGVLALKPLETAAFPKKPEDNTVELRNVSYSYDGIKDALHNVSLTVRAGQTAALVGSSGGGKSTLANIILRFFDPQSGKVILGGADLREISKEALMNAVSFVFQDSHLIKASIFENVRMAKPEASEDEAMAALEAAQCGDIIKKLPRGADTVIGTKGIHLSGGEQQRIAIARAILKNAPVLILDEATAFADPDNERLVQKAFEKMTKNKTVIMVAHRLTTIKNADRIYVLKDGQIAEHGTHSQLIEKKGLYNKMWNDYQTSAEWRISK